MTVALLFSAVSFIFFGLGCFMSPRMRTEFVRYGLNSFRKTVGALQLVGASGLLLGYFFSSVIAFVSATGLTILMTLGFAVRIKIKDSVWQSFPALFYAILNFYLAEALFDLI
ncbi:DoxX family protein [Costertonia aggregata]|nr:DoxX family protein [Costertonia aggregata]